jgi:hypothetical protein
MAERLPPGVYDTESMKLSYLPNGLEANGIHYPDTNGGRHSRSDSIRGTSLASPTRSDSTSINGTLSIAQSFRDSPGTNVRDDHLAARLSNGGGGVQPSGNSMSEAIDGKEPWSPQDGDNGMKSRDSSLVANGNQVEAEWIEQYEPGVFITLVALRDGTRDLKRVRFRYFLISFYFKY